MNGYCDKIKKEGTYMEYEADAKQSIKQADLIFGISTILFTILAVGLVVGAFVFLYFAMITINKEFDWIKLVYAGVMLICILPAWVLKQVMDAIAMSLYNTAVILDRQNNDTLKESKEESNLDRQLKEAIAKKKEQK